MPSRMCVVPSTREWKQAYLAAIMEKNHTRIVGRIQNAREKLAVRERELTLGTLAPGDEMEAIHDAYYMLQALQNSLSYRGDVEDKSSARVFQSVSSA